MVELPGQNPEDTRRMSPADAANLGEEFSWLHEDHEPHDLISFQSALGIRDGAGGV